jgi:hypothetical protein
METGHPINGLPNKKTGERGHRLPVQLDIGKPVLTVRTVRKNMKVWINCSAPQGYFAKLQGLLERLQRDRGICHLAQIVSPQCFP